MRPNPFRRWSKTLGVILLLAAPPWAAATQESAGNTVERALTEAAQRRQPVFVEFHAPWCHSCYFMQKNVLHGAEWEAVRARAVTVELDADSPEGARWKARWNIVGYPSYVLLDERGTELGRILGDRPRKAFYEELDRILANTFSIEELQRRAAAGAAESLDAARELFRAWYQRGQMQAALNWFAQRDESSRARFRSDAAIAALLARMELLAAATARNPKACIALAPPVLGGELRCELMWELNEFQSCLKPLPPAEARRQLEPYRKSLLQLQTSVLEWSAAGCGDDRGVVQTAADFYESADDAKAAEKVLRQGVAYARRKLDDEPSRDRNLADNLRYYLERLQDRSGLDSWYRKLVKAYPDDYVYHYRYGRELLEQGKPRDALPQLERAAALAYGINRLRVAEQRVLALQALKREAEARTVVSEALRANGPWFPEDAARLKALL